MTHTSICIGYNIGCIFFVMWWTILAGSSTLIGSLEKYSIQSEYIANIRLSRITAVAMGTAPHTWTEFSLSPLFVANAAKAANEDDLIWVLAAADDEVDWE